MKYSLIFCAALLLPRGRTDRRPTQYKVVLTATKAHENKVSYETTTTTTQCAAGWPPPRTTAGDPSQKEIKTMVTGHRQKNAEFQAVVVAIVVDIPSQPSTTCALEL